MHFSSRAVVPFVASLVLMTGCAATEEPDTASTTGTGVAGSSSAAGTTGATGQEEPAEVTSFPGDSEPDTQPAGPEARLTVSAVRLAAQDGYDRVVFELGGAGAPGWDVRYVDQPTADGSGDPVAVAGEAVLQVGITGAGYPYETGVEEYAAADPLTAAGTAGVTEVVFAATYEGVTTAFIGTRAAGPFRVYALEDPTRVVVEVAHAG